MTSLQSQKSFLKGCQNLSLQRIIGVITPKALRYMNICNISKYVKMRTLCHAVSLKGGRDSAKTDTISQVQIAKTQLTFTRSKLTIETLEKCVKYVQNEH